MVQLSPLCSIVFFNSRARSVYLFPFFFTFFQFYSVVSRDSKIDNFSFSFFLFFFLLIIISYGVHSILSNLTNAVVWMVSSFPLICRSSSPFINPLGIVPSAPITIGITVTFTFHSCCFFNSPARSRYLSLFAFF